MWRLRLRDQGPNWPGALRLPPRSLEKQQQMAGEFLGRVEAERPVVRAEAAQGELSQGAVRLMIEAVLHPGEPLMELYTGLNLHPAEGKAALDELQARGFVWLHRLPRKGRGAWYVVPEVTARADGELRRRGIKRPEPVLKGGFKHDVYGRWEGKWAAKRHFRHWYERTFGKKTFDFVYEQPNGKLVAVEDCLTGTAAFNAKQAMKGLENEGISQLVIACETRKFAQEVEGELKKLDELGLYRGRVRVCQLAEFVD